MTSQPIVVGKAPWLVWVAGGSARTIPCFWIWTIESEPELLYLLEEVSHSVSP